MQEKFTFEECGVTEQLLNGIVELLLEKEPASEKSFLLQVSMGSKKLASSYLKQAYEKASTSPEQKQFINNVIISKIEDKYNYFVEKYFGHLYDIVTADQQDGITNKSNDILFEKFKNLPNFESMLTKHISSQLSEEIKNKPFTQNDLDLARTLKNIYQKGSGIPEISIPKPTAMSVNLAILIDHPFFRTQEAKISFQNKTTSTTVKAANTEGMVSKKSDTKDNSNAKALETNSEEDETPNYKPQPKEKKADFLSRTNGKSPAAPKSAFSYTSLARLNGSNCIFDLAD